ncbi:MAG: tetratricopeptide repeat protein [Candidatus Thermochlorobacter sp.]
MKTLLKKTRKISIWLLAASCFVAGVAALNLGCAPGNLFDPTRVQNDNVTEDNLIANPDNTTRGILTGLRRTLTIGYGALGTLTELASDNYTNATSFVSQLLDTPSLIASTDLTLSGGAAYFNLLRVNAVAEFAFTSIIPNDRQATNLQRAEIRFLQGLALTLLAENWSHFPIEDKGQPRAAREVIEIAVQRLQEAQTFAATTPNVTAANNLGDGVGDIRANILLALARAQRLLGNKAEARRNAEQALQRRADYVYYVHPDITNGPVPDIYNHALIRTDNNFQPLPRLEFLDPKCASIQGATPLPLLKAEECHLILAEIALSDNNLAEARAQMRSAVALARRRPTELFSDANERRIASPAGPSLAALTSAANFPGPGNLPSRILVLSSPSVRLTSNADSVYAASLVRRRGAGSPQFALPVISGTSLTEADIDALPADRTAMVRTLYLLRQEIFFLEARRMSDLGIRFPVPERQTQTNPNMPLGSPGTLVTVPEWIPAGNAALNTYTVTTSGGLTIVTIQTDMNDVISRNIARISPFAGF